MSKLPPGCIQALTGVLRECENIIVCHLKGENTCSTSKSSGESIMLSVYLYKHAEQCYQNENWFFYPYINHHWSITPNIHIPGYKREPYTEANLIPEEPPTNRRTSPFSNIQKNHNMRIPRYHKEFIIKTKNLATDSPKPNSNAELNLYSDKGRDSTLNRTHS